MRANSIGVIVIADLVLALVAAYTPTIRLC
jgi:hypothetical protein